MSDQPTNPQPANPTDAPTPPPPPAEARTFEQRMNDFGRQAGAAGERLGRDAEAAAQRWTKDPGVVAAGDTLARVWGLIVLAVGVWFFADITLQLDMPSIAWRDLWPLAQIVLGVAVLVRALATRRV